MQDVTKFLKALADGNRLRLLVAVARGGELCACQLTDLLGVSGATCSRHLSLLVEAGLMARRKDGRWMHYRSNMEQLEQAHRRIARSAVALLADTPQGAADQARLDEILGVWRETLCGQKERP